MKYISLQFNHWKKNPFFCSDYLIFFSFVKLRSGGTSDSLHKCEVLSAVDSGTISTQIIKSIMVCFRIIFILSVIKQQKNIDWSLENLKNIIIYHQIKPSKLCVLNLQFFLLFISTTCISVAINVLVNKK